MVVVVLDPPGLKGIYEGRKHQCAHNVLYQLVLAEGAVSTVVSDHKELQPEQGCQVTASVYFQFSAIVSSPTASCQVPLLACQSPPHAAQITEATQLESQAYSGDLNSTGMTCYAAMQRQSLKGDGIPRSMQFQQMPTPVVASTTGSWL